MSDWLITLILGVVEGITEFLPVSSTGHLLLVEHLLKIHRSDLFNVVIQCGAVIAVLPLFPERLRQIVFRWRDPATRDFVVKLFAAFFITGCGGLVLEKRHFKLPEEILPVAVALLIGGILFLLVERCLKGKVSCSEVTWTVALAGWISGLIAKGQGFGLLGNMIVGIVGAFLGGFVFGLLGISAHNFLGQLIFAILGSLLFLWLLRFIRK